jgi:hypothetical protein
MASLPKRSAGKPPALDGLAHKIILSVSPYLAPAVGVGVGEGVGAVVGDGAGEGDGAGVVEGAGGGAGVGVVSDLAQLINTKTLASNTNRIMSNLFILLTLLILFYFLPYRCNG